MCGCAGSPDLSKRVGRLELVGCFPKVVLPPLAGSSSHTACHTPAAVTITPTLKHHTPSLTQNTYAGNEGSVDKLLKQIGGFMSDIAGE